MLFSALGGADSRLIYRHYATLYFVFCVDSSESELGILDLIQVFTNQEKYLLWISKEENEDYFGQKLSKKCHFDKNAIFEGFYLITSNFCH